MSADVYFDRVYPSKHLRAEPQRVTYLYNLVCDANHDAFMAFLHEFHGKRITVKLINQLVIAWNNMAKTAKEEIDAPYEDMWSGASIRYLLLPSVGWRLKIRID